LIAVEVNTEVRLVRAAAPPPARANPDIADQDILAVELEMEVRRVISVIQIVQLQVRPVGGSHIEPDLLDDTVIEKVVSSLSLPKGGAQGKQRGCDSAESK